MNYKRMLIFAACSGAVAVALGAFGAHGLQTAVEKGKLTESDLHAFETGVRYQFYHTIALFMIPALAQFLQPRTGKFAANSFLAGICLFSGSLYLLSLSPLLFKMEMNWLGPITPLGGLFFIAGWIFLLVAAIRGK